MNSLCMATILVLIVIFTIVLLSVFFRKSTDKLITKIEDDSSYVEIRLREIMKKYPKSEIYVSNVSKDAESYQIIEKLHKDFPQIHISE